MWEGSPDLHQASEDPDTRAILQFENTGANMEQTWAGTGRNKKNDRG
jgi:hypothetical protein